MVAQKITCPSRSDDFGSQYPIKPNTERYGFFSNESQDSNCFESGKPRSFKEREQPASNRFNRSGLEQRRIFKLGAGFTSGNNQLYRGK